MELGFHKEINMNKMSQCACRRAPWDRILVLQGGTNTKRLIQQENQARGIGGNEENAISFEATQAGIMEVSFESKTGRR